MADGRALIFASEEARDTLDDAGKRVAEQDAQAEQLFREPGRTSRWVAESGAGARLCGRPTGLPRFAVGRDGGLGGGGMEAARNGVSVDVALSFDEEALRRGPTTMNLPASRPPITASPSRRARCA